MTSINAACSVEFFCQNLDGKVWTLRGPSTVHVHVQFSVNVYLHTRQKERPRFLARRRKKKRHHNRSGRAEIAEMPCRVAIPGCGKGRKPGLSSFAMMLAASCDLDTNTIILLIQAIHVVMMFEPEELRGYLKKKNNGR